MLRRLPLAHLVCPSAPFLAPRLLYTPISLAGLSGRCGAAPSGFQRCAYATKETKWRIRKVTHRTQKDKEFLADPSAAKKKYAVERKNYPVDELTSLIQKFRSACDSRKVDTIMDLYPTVVASKRLNHNDTRRIAQALHTHVRFHHFDTSKMPKPFAFVDQLSEDIRAGNLEPHPLAHVHILGIYKECKMFHQGHAFWQWLVDQDSTYVNQAVYGAAIELLAYRGETSLQQLEGLYLDGLKRFPGTFAEYHLSPEAIVPDRTQRINITGIPISLLQGILTARLLSRDWKQAYLALDTALRLFPIETPSRFFELFLLERPVAEAYTVFLLACRSGVCLKPYQLTALMAKLSKSMAASSSLQEKFVILRGMANAMYAYLECGGSLEGPHIGAFLNAFGNLLPLRQPGQVFLGDEAVLRNVVVTHAHGTMSTLIQAGMPPRPHLFIALISLAGKLGVPDLLDVTLQDIETAEMDIGSIGRRCVLASAGFLNDEQLIEDYWKKIVSKGELEDTRSSHAYWVTLAKACNAAGYQSFFEEQLSKLQHTISTDAMQEASHQLNLPIRKQETARPPLAMDPAEFDSELQLLQEHMKNIAAVIMSGQPLDLQKNPFQMSLRPEERSLGSLEDLRVVYDELTTDPYQPAPSPPSESSPNKAPSSSTGISFDELRFQNWVTILELMNEARATEFEFQRRLDIAIASGKPLKDTLLLQSSEKQEVPLNLSKEELRRRIRSLRAPSESLSARSGMSVSSPNRRVPMPAFSDDPSITPSTIPWGTQSKPKLRYHVTDGFTPDVSTDNVKHRPLGKPKLRYHIGLESTHDAPAPVAMITSYRPLQPSGPLPATKCLDEQLEEFANGNNKSTTE